MVVLGQKYSYQHPIEFQPETYVCYKTIDDILVDGKADEESWKKAPWSNSFVDIEGDLKPNPFLDTKVKMLWDSAYFYFYAYLEEPHVWAKLENRDDIIFYDDDFEIFIDPDGDGHTYYEFEVNAYNTLWDLLLVRPYRAYKAPQAVYEYNVFDIKTAVHIDGTLNDPADTDNGWSVEIAIPWTALKELAPRAFKPNAGEQWRVNFSRVDWDMEVLEGNYEKEKDAETGKIKSEHNWVWSPTGRINMHMPELWGYVQFVNTKAGNKNIVFDKKGDEAIKWGMWNLYWQQMEYYLDNNSFTDQLNNFTVPNLGLNFDPKIYVTPNHFEIVAKSLDGKSNWVLDKEGRIYNTATKQLKKIKY